MNLIQYVPQALRTEKLLHTPVARLFHAALGLITETGEFTTPIKRIAIYDKAIDKQGDDGKTLRDHMREEIGDAMWYIAIGIDALQANVFAFSTSSAGAPTTPTEDLALDLAGLVGHFAVLTVNAKRRGTVEQDERDRMIHLLNRMVRLLHAVCAALGFSLEAVMDENIDKLRLRFPDAYSNEAAEARADKGGLDARNS